MMFVCRSSPQRREQETIADASVGTRILTTEAVLSAVIVADRQGVDRICHMFQTVVIFANRETKFDEK
jgi:hypothetical protein